jgi:hypothetical protein
MVLSKSISRSNKDKRCPPKRGASFTWDTKVNELHLRAHIIATLHHSHLHPTALYLVVKCSQNSTAPTEPVSISFKHGRHEWESRVSGSRISADRLRWVVESKRSFTQEIESAYRCFSKSAQCRTCPTGSCVGRHEESDAYIRERTPVKFVDQHRATLHARSSTVSALQDIHTIGMFSRHWRIVPSWKPSSSTNSKDMLSISGY